ncbi:hypothetical protein DF182_17370 [Chitinophaga flava]|uniref:Uncharacterized protein n=1 Tax=Chitinophaga flava TaxID=2259036 RepID=A0A365XPT3_9BACT|nr:hypothetical protein DF182_17370 [Chitinophaga flava]
MKIGRFKRPYFFMVVSEGNHTFAIRIFDVLFYTKIDYPVSDYRKFKAGKKYSKQFCYSHI